MVTLRNFRQDKFEGKRWNKERYYASQSTVVSSAWHGCVSTHAHTALPTEYQTVLTNNLTHILYQINYNRENLCISPFFKITYRTVQLECFQEKTNQ